MRIDDCKWISKDGLVILLLLTLLQSAIAAEHPASSKDWNQCDLSLDHLDKQAAIISERSDQDFHHLENGGCKFETSEFRCPDQFKGKDMPLQLFERMVQRINDDPKKPISTYREMTAKQLYLEAKILFGREKEAEHEKNP
jgi:hypothetical protein